MKVPSILQVQADAFNAAPPDKTSGLGEILYYEHLPDVVAAMGGKGGSLIFDEATKFKTEHSPRMVSVVGGSTAQIVKGLQREIRSKDSMLQTAKAELDTAWARVAALEKELHKLRTKKQNTFAAHRRILKKTK